MMHSGKSIFIQEHCFKLEKGIDLNTRYFVGGIQKNKKGQISEKTNLSSLVGLLGFEPRRTESKSVVLPLHYNPIVSKPAFRFRSAKIRFQPFSAKRILGYLFKNIKKQSSYKQIAHHIHGIVGTPAISF